MSQPNRWFSIREASNLAKCDVCGRTGCVAVGVVERAGGDKTRDVATLVLCRWDNAVLTERMLGSALKKLAILPIPAREKERA